MKIALQLYSIREITEKDGLCAALDKAKEMGYDGVEFAGLFGLSAEEAKAELDKRGLGCAGFHDGYEEVFNNTDTMIEKAKICGAYSLCVPYYDTDSAQGWAAFAKKLDDAGAKFAKEGILFGFHNHEHEIRTIEGGVRPIDIILENSKPENVFFEMDTRHVKAAGEEPAEFAKKYSGRMPVLHARDWNGKEDCDVGGGIVDFVSTVREGGMPEWFVVENENEDLEMNIRQLKSSVKYLRETFE